MPIFSPLWKRRSSFTGIKFVYASRADLPYGSIFFASVLFYCVKRGVRAVDNNFYPGFFERAAGVLAGQFCGDSYGSQYEFMRTHDIEVKMSRRGEMSFGSSSMADTLPGQLTDDSELALALMRSIVENKCYNAESARRRYCEWLESNPFDVGITTSNALRGVYSRESQANGAMMRLSPLCIWLAAHTESNSFEAVDEFVSADAALTHPSRICVEANVLFARVVVSMLRDGLSAPRVMQMLPEWCAEIGADSVFFEIAAASCSSPPEDFITHMGWVLIAFHNALYRLVHADSPADGIIGTVRCGGDTDTNAAIAGVLLGARFGFSAFPKSWIDCVEMCEPGGSTPRPQIFHAGSIDSRVRNLIGL